MLASLFILIGAVYCILVATTTANRFQIDSASVSLSSARAKSAGDYANKVSSYWTEQKMRDAVPVMPKKKMGARTSASKSIKNSDPQVLASGTTGSLQRDADAGSNRQSSKQVFGPTGRHTYTIGKVFWEAGNNMYGTCSATIVTASNKNTIVTAAHCCYDTDAKKWFINQNFVFVPAYKNGAQPYGKWAAKSMSVDKAWTDKTDYNCDVCFINLYPNAQKQNIQDVLGAQGLGANMPRNALTYSFGYPGNLAKGEVMQYCSGNAVFSKAGNGYIGQAIPCDMTQGCSGGPWLQNFTVSTGVGYITSVNSFLLNNAPNYIHGPYFNSAIWSLYQQSSTK